MSVSPDLDLMATHLALLTSNLPEGAGLVITGIRGQRKGRALDYLVHAGNVDEAASDCFEIASTRNLYVSATATDEETFASITKRGRGSRGGKADARWIYALFADLDVAGPNHAADNLPPTVGDALGLLEGIPRASLILHSGGGLQAWWPLDEPVPVDEDSKGVLDRYVRRIASHGAASGWHVDAGVGEPARILRIAGTLNLKQDNEPRLVDFFEHLVELDGSIVRYRFDDLREHALPLEPEQPKTPPIERTSTTRLAAPSMGDGPNILNACDVASWGELFPSDWKNLGEQTVEGRTVEEFLRPGATSDKSVRCWPEACHVFSEQVPGLPAGGHSKAQILAWRCGIDLSELARSIIAETRDTRSGHEIPSAVVDEARRILEAFEQAETERFTVGPATSTASARPRLDLWTPDSTPPRPMPTREMFHGPIGEFALAAREFTEADPVGIFSQSLTLYGAACHRSAHMVAGNARHGAALFVVNVGRSAKARKGTAGGVAKALIALVDPPFLASRLLGGFGSGEAIVEALAGGSIVPIGGQDSRGCIYEPEFASLLIPSARQGSTISTKIREAWDGDPLRNSTRSSGKLVATDYHLGAIGHITIAEFRARLDATEALNGMGNRWLYFFVDRGPLRPDGGNVPRELLEDYGALLQENLGRVRKFGTMRRSPEAEKRWHEVYALLAADEPSGIVQSMLARDDAQNVRLGVALALADGSPIVQVEHVDAAFAIWNYSRATVAHIFGDATGDSDANRLLEALRSVAPEGMDATKQGELFARHGNKAARARKILEEQGLAASVEVRDTGGRPATITYAVNPTRNLSSLYSLYSRPKDHDAIGEVLDGHSVDLSVDEKTGGTVGSLGARKASKGFAREGDEKHRHARKAREASKGVAPSRKTASPEVA